MLKCAIIRCGLLLVQLFLVSLAQGQITGVTATATPIINNGFLTSATLINGGAGYVVAPAVLVSDVSGSNAVIVAQVHNGAVTNLVVEEAGRSYSAAATIAIAPPRPLLQFSRVRTNLVLTWGDSSLLQSATNANGPYADVVSARSPYTNGPGKEPAQYFRLRGMVLAGNPPPPISLGDQVSCTPVMANPALAVSVQAGLSVEWYDAPVGGALLAAGTTNYIPTNRLAGSYSYFAESRIPGTAIVSSSRAALTLTLLPGSTAAVSGSATICNGSVAMIQAALTGAGPWQIIWSDGLQQNIAASPATRVVSPVNLFLNAATNFTYMVTNVTDISGCVGDITGMAVVTVLPRPTATLIAADVVSCNDGSGYALTNVLTGVGPWTVWWNDGTMQVSSVPGSGPALLTRWVYPTNAPGANQPKTNVYYVTAVTADGCAGNAPGDIRGTNMITIKPRPTATASGSATICNGSMAMIQAALTGAGPWQIIWSDGSQQNVAASPATRVVSPVNLFLNAATNFTYMVTNVTDISGCVGDITGMAVVTVLPRPTATVSGSATICNGSAAVIQAALTGAGPWQILWSDGFVQNAATSPATRIISPTQTSVYGVTLVSDVNGCSGDISGTAVVTVVACPP